MEKFRKIVHLGSLFYLVTCLLNSLFLPSSLSLNFDNYLFVFAFTHLIFVFLYQKELRIMIGLFVLLFLWSFLVENWNKGFFQFAQLPYLLYFLKWPALIMAFRGPLLNETQSTKIHKLIDLVFLVLVGMNIIMIIDPFGVGQIVQHLYVTNDYTNFVYYNELGTYRVAGTFSNPNDNAALFGSFVLYYAFIRGKEFWYYLLLALSITVITQSRTVFLALFVIAFIWFLIRLSKKFRSKTLWIIFTIGLFCLIGLVFVSKNLFSLVSGDAFISNSVQIRFHNFFSFLEGSTKDKIVGLGVIDNTQKNLGFYFDSEFIALLFQFGLIGLIIWVMIFTYNLFFLQRGNNAMIFYRIYFFFILLLSLTNFTFLNSHIGVVVSFFLGVTLFFINNTWKSMPINKPHTK